MGHLIHDFVLYLHRTSCLPSITSIMSLQDQMGNTENKLEVLFPVVSKPDFSELLSLKSMGDQ